MNREEITLEQVYPVCTMCFVAQLLNADEIDGVRGVKLLNWLGNQLQAKMAHITSKYGRVQVFYIL